MDSLDIRILRELMRDRVVVIGSSDPRLSAEAIARAVKVDPTTVRDRLKAWRASGFLQGFTVLPNLALFGAGLASGAARLPDPREKRAFVDALPKVDGVVGMMEHVGEWVGLAYADESAAQLERVQASVRAMPGVTEITPSFVVGTPSCEADLTPLDWRIVEALRRDPQGSLPNAAKSAGVSTRTFARRYQKLVDAGALWSFGLFEFGRCAGRVPAHVIVNADPAADAEALAKRLTRAAADEWYAWHVVPPDRAGGSVSIIDVHLLLGTMGKLEELHALARSLPGVVEVESYHPLRLRMFDGWAEPRIREAAKRAGA